MTFDVGEPQGIDSMNPLVGQLVPSYEAWNLQYATLTDKSAEDFSTIPGLAESWKKSDGGRTYTYKLRDGLKWSDGKPLTSKDIVWTINTAREEEWLNHSATVANLTASAPDDTTVVLKSSVPDPKLPTMDVYILPEHIWGKMNAKERRTYDGLDGVGSGTFVLEKFEKGQFARFKANPNYWGGKPAVDQVILRKFNNPDAMVAALKTGELDAAYDIPGERVQPAQGRRQPGDQRGLPGGLQRGGDQRRRRAQEAASRAARPEGASGDSARDRQGDARGPRARRARQAGPDHRAVARPELAARARRGGLRVRPRRGQPDTRRGRLRGHRRRRRARDARRRRTAELHLLRPLGRGDRHGDRRVRAWLAGRDRHRHHAEGGRRQPAHHRHRQGRVRHVRVGLGAVRGSRTRCSPT